jgi:large subunit ribosomal protein L12e
MASTTSHAFFILLFLAIPPPHMCVCVCVLWLLNHCFSHLYPAHFALCVAGSFCQIMPPKFDPSQELIVIVRAVGGEVAATASLAPKVGPLGLNAKKIGEDIAKATKDWKGLKVTCELRVKNRVATVVVTPSVASRLIRALKEPPRDRKKVKNVKHNGNIPFAEIIKIAKESQAKSMGSDLKAVVMEVLGTAVSIGCTVDGESPIDVQNKVREGKLKVPK